MSEPPTGELDAPEPRPWPDVLEELAVSIGSQISQLREEQGWSRSILTRHSGTSRAWLTRIEEGKDLLSLVALARIASALGKRVQVRLVDEEEVAGREQGA
jgi:transcriptional regulator with XRE-family HTH domain